jgi:hypothetical protein
LRKPVGDIRRTGGRDVPEVAPQRRARERETVFKTGELNALLSSLPRPIGNISNSGGRAGPQAAWQLQLRGWQTSFRVVVAANLERDRKNREGRKAHSRTRHCKACDGEGKNQQGPEASSRRGWCS